MLHGRINKSVYAVIHSIVVEGWGTARKRLIEARRNVFEKEARLLGKQNFV